MVQDDGAESQRDIWMGVDGVLDTRVWPTFNECMAPPRICRRNIDTANDQSNSELPFPEPLSNPRETCYLVMFSLVTRAQIYVEYKNSSVNRLMGILVYMIINC